MQLLLLNMVQKDVKTQEASYSEKYLIKWKRKTAPHG